MNIDEARKTLKEQGYLVFHLWHKQDVENILEYLASREDKYKPYVGNDDFIEKVIALLDKSFDADLGVNWCTIRSAIETIADENNNEL